MTEIERIEDLGRQRVLATLERFGTIRTAASILGVTHTALRRWMLMHSISRPSPQGDRMRGPSRKRKSSAKFEKWLKENPGVVLPRSTKGIARVTGCTCDQIKTYLYKRRKMKRSYIERMPNLLAVPGLELMDRYKRAIVLASCEAYRWHLDHWSLRVAILAQRGDEELVFPVPNVRAFYEAVSKMASQGLPSGTGAQRMYPPGSGTPGLVGFREPELNREASEGSDP